MQDDREAVERCALLSSRLKWAEREMIDGR
jgi:hypothetical protein